MKRTRAAAWAFVLALGIFFCSGDARASTGLCDTNATTAQACINAIQTSGGVVNEIFHDAKGRDALSLPVYGTLLPVTAIFPTCLAPPAKSMNCAGCNPGTSHSPFDCPGQYTCAGGTATFGTVSAAVNGAPDRNWGHPCRLTNHALVGGCPDYSSACVADGDTTGYFPWEGLVFDLGGPSNQVAIFAENDHGPQPCESAEYTVYLTNDPTSRDILLTPTTTGSDPKKWNRAVLKKIYTKGFVEIRPPDPGNAAHAACGDTAQYSVEEDSMVTVYALPCGINFRYAAVVAGNDGRDFPECQYASSEAELDAVAGLTEAGDAVCPDKDGDTFVDCTCPGAPKLCDCDDNDPNTHPNAPEACNAGKDFNCNGVTPEPCPPDKGCADGVCVPFCGTEIGCAPGSTCQTVDGGAHLCIPTDCTVGGCPPGSTCDATTKKCVPNCSAGVVCPPGEKCIAGECLNPCRDVKCPAGFACKDGTCNAPCTCFAGDVGCSGTDKCDRPTEAGAGTDQCVPPDCLGVSCAAGKYCKGGLCVDYCSGVKCPPGEVCVPPPPPSDAGVADAGADAATDAAAPPPPAFGCVNLCAGVTCTAPEKCDSTTGKCVAPPPPDGGSITPPPPPGNFPDGGSGDGGGDGFGIDAAGDSGGCGCTTAGFASASFTAIGGILALFAMLAFRRRR